MPCAPSCRTSCRTPAGQATASQLQEPGSRGNGNAHARFSIDFPPGFVSRTSNLSDPCFIGRRGNEAARGHEPVQQCFQENRSVKPRKREKGVKR